MSAPFLFAVSDNPETIRAEGEAASPLTEDTIVNGRISKPGEIDRYKLAVEPGQKWHFRQSIEYSVSSNRAVLDLASRYRDTFLFNMYRMGKNSIDRGNSDHWTMTPKRLEALEAAIAKDNPNMRGLRSDVASDTPGGGGFDAARIDIKYYQQTHDPKLRDPRAYIIPSSQVDFLTATKFVNTLLKNGIDIHRATADFEVAGKKSSRTL